VSQFINLQQFGGQPLTMLKLLDFLKYLGNNTKLYLQGKTDDENENQNESMSEKKPVRSRFLSTSDLKNMGMINPANYSTVIDSSNQMQGSRSS
jgi:hypothetical protein